jgi:hypothetical protein
MVLRVTTVKDVEKTVSVIKTGVSTIVCELDGTALIVTIDSKFDNDEEIDNAERLLVLEELIVGLVVELGIGVRVLAVDEVEVTLC